MGQELDGFVTPITTGLDFAVRKAGGYFDADALAAARNSGAVNHVISLVLDGADASPLGQEPICRDGAIIGETTTATFGHRVGRPVAPGQCSQILGRRHLNPPFPES